MAKVDIEELEKSLTKKIIGYSAMWGAIFSTMTTLTISIMMGIRHKDTLVEVTYSSIKIISYLVKFVALWI